MIKNTRIIEIFARFKIFLGNGQGYVSDFKYPVLLATALKVWLPETSSTLLGALVLLAVLAMTALGWLDLKFIKLHQTQQNIGLSEYNPYFERLEKNLNTLRD